MEILTMTAKEKARAHRDQQIASEYTAIKKAFPKAPDARIIRTIAASGKFTIGEQGIKRVLYATKTIVPTRKSS